jgi:hypothetical protein
MEVRETALQDWDMTRKEEFRVQSDSALDMIRL